MIATQDLVNDYERLLREAFAQTIRCAVLTPAGFKGESPEEPVIEVLCVPDGREGEFLEFMIDVLPDLVEERSLPEVQLVPHNESDSHEHYGHLCRRTRSRGRAEFSASKDVWAFFVDWAASFVAESQEGYGRTSGRRRSRKPQFPGDTHYALAA